MKVFIHFGIDRRIIMVPCLLTSDIMYTNLPRDLFYLPPYLGQHIHILPYIPKPE